MVIRRAFVPILLKKKKKAKKKNLGLVLSRAGDFVVVGSYEVEVLSACSVSVFRKEVSQTPVPPL